jgi:FG-GAP-like repeat
MGNVIVAGSISVLLSVVSAAHGQAGFETSSDGHLRVSITGMGDAEPTDTGTRGIGVPFLGTPDAVVELRRQIGGLQIADFDGDGHNDLVAVCYISNSFPPYDDWHDMIFYGTESGLSTSPGWISDVETHTGDVQVGDLNNDGWMDIVTIHGGVRRDSVRVYYGSKSGVETTPGYTSNTNQSSWGTSGALFDVENDGDLDLVTTNQGISPDPFRPMLMFRNNNGMLTSAAVWQSAEDSIQGAVDAGDVNGDGFVDLGVSKWVNFESGIYLNLGGALSATPAATVGSTDTDKGAAFADIDGDGALELGIGGDPSTVYDYSGGLLTPIYQSNPPFSGPQDFRFSDIDLDGDPDLAEINFSDGKAHIYLNRDGQLDEQPTWTYDAPEVGTALAFGDLNGDGRPDLALGYSGDTSIRIFYAIAPPCPADLNGDGVLNFFDVSIFINTQFDFNGDGAFNFFDVSAFVAAMSAGCP